MKFIGITGGVGAGKSEILHYIQERYPAKILLADELAHELMMPGTECYAQIRQTFGKEDIFLPQGEIEAGKLSSVIFSDSGKRMQLNEIVHPAVKKEIIKMADQERKKGEVSYFILEAALLIEEGYDKICDELWYIYTSKAIRRNRLKESRGYSDAKIDAIFCSQISEEEYRRYCKVIIDNNGPLQKTFDQINEAFAKEHTKQKQDV